MFEAAELAHAGIQRVLAGVTERRMAEVVRQADCLDQRFVEMQSTGYRAGNLRNFQRMGQARPVQVAFMIHKHLGFVNETTEGRGVNDTVAVALELAAITSRGFRVAPATTGFFLRRVRFQRQVIALDRIHEPLRDRMPDSRASATLPSMYASPSCRSRTKRSCPA